MNWWTHLLMFGGMSLLIPTALLLVCIRWARPAFLGDYPADIQAAAPPFDTSEKARGRVLGSLFLISLMVAQSWITWTWLAADPDRGFFSAYLMALGAFVLFALIDLVIVDWLVICWWRPGWAVIPGTENAAGWGDYGFHFRAQLAPKALVATFVMPAVIAGVALAVAHWS